VRLVSVTLLERTTLYILEALNLYKYRNFGDLRNSKNVSEKASQEVKSSSESTGNQTKMGMGGQGPNAKRKASSSI
jgi:hypothetical protein